MSIRVNNLHFNGTLKDPMVNISGDISLNVGAGTKSKRPLNSEPVPDWEEAKAVFKWGWELHWISFVALFLGLALYSTIKLIAASKRNRLREKVSRNVSYAVHFLVIVLGITRALALVLFPYEVTTNVNDANIVIPLYVHRIIFGLGFPCFMAAFALIQITFTASVKTVPLTYSKLRRIRFLVLVIVGHFSVVIVADVVTALVESTSALYMVCTAYLLSMTLFTGIRITKTGWKVVRENKPEHNLNMQNSMSASTVSVGTAHRIQRASFNARAVRKVFVITALTICFCIALFALKIYDLVEVIEYTFVLGKNKKLAPWPWFIHETLFRLTEFALACTVLYAVSPLKPPKRGCFSCCWCSKSGKGEINTNIPQYRERTGTNEMTISPPETAGKISSNVVEYRERTDTNEITISPPETAGKISSNVVEYRERTDTNEITISPPETAGKITTNVVECQERTDTYEMKIAGSPPETICKTYL